MAESKHFYLFATEIDDVYHSAAVHESYENLFYLNSRNFTTERNIKIDLRKLKLVLLYGLKTLDSK